MAQTVFSFRICIRIFRKQDRYQTGFRLDLHLNSSLERGNNTKRDNLAPPLLAALNRHQVRA